MKTNLDITYRRPLIFAIAFHVILLMLFLFRFNFDNATHSAPASTNIVQATLVAPSAMTSPSPTTVQPTTPSVEQETITPPEKKPVIAEKPTLTPAIEKSVLEEKSPSHPDAQEKEIASLMAKEAEKSLLLEKKALKKKVALEKQQQLNKEKQKKLQAEIEQQVEKEQQQKKTQALVKKRQHEIEQLLQQDLVESHPTKSSGPTSEKVTKSSRVSSAMDNKAVDHYKNLIISAISSRWIVPENLRKGVECRLRVHVAPGGVVINAKLIKSSGDTTLDRSAESAVYKASPLPVPKDAVLFAHFREFNLVVKPEGILAE